MGRLGQAEEQYGTVHWPTTLREKVWGDQYVRYVGVNPEAEGGKDWRSPSKKRRPQSAFTLGTRTLSGGLSTRTLSGAPSPAMWESSQLVGANAPSRQAKMAKGRSSGGAFSRRDTMDPASPHWSPHHTIGRPRPSTAGRVQHVSTAHSTRFDQWDETHRPEPKYSVPASTARTSSSSGASSASTMSFVDRYGNADPRKQRLMMMKKKIDLQNAMVKTAQVSLGGRPCTPEMVSRLGAEMGHELERSVRRATLQSLTRRSVLEEKEEDHEALAGGDIDAELLNHEGEWGVAELAEGASSLPQRVAKVMTEQMGLEVGMKGSSTPGAATTMSSGSEWFERSSVLSGAGGGRRGGNAEGHSQASLMPWRAKDEQRQRTVAASQRIRQSGSMAMNLFEGISTKISLGDMIAALRRQPSVGALDAGFCEYRDFEAAMHSNQIRLSRMEGKWLRKMYRGPKSLFGYQDFLKSFWPNGDLDASAASAALAGDVGGGGGGRELVERVAARITRHLVQHEKSDAPPAMDMQSKLLQWDHGGTGVVSLTALTAVLQQYGVTTGTAGIPGDAVAMLCTRFSRGGDTDEVEYRPLLRALFPPSLTMAAALLDRRSSVPVVGHSVAEGQARTYFDVVSQIRTETKGNKRVLQKCFRLQDVEGAGRLTPEAVVRALLLLRVGMDTGVVQKVFSKFCGSDGLVDYGCLLEDMFAGVHHSATDFDLDGKVRSLQSEIYRRCIENFKTLLLAFEKLSGSATARLPREGLEGSLRVHLQLTAKSPVVDALWTQWCTRLKHTSAIPLSFDEFASMLSEHPAPSLSTVLPSFHGGQTISELKRVVREAITARLSGGWKSGGDMRQAFHMFDKQRTGFVPYGRMAAALKDILGLHIDEVRLAKLMSEYDPDGSGGVNYDNFVRHVMNSTVGESMGHPHDAKQLTKAPRAQPDWPLEKVEAVLQEKLTKAWTQMINEMRMADTDKTGRVARSAFRQILDKFGLVLDDSMLSRVCAKFSESDHGPVSINQFIHYYETFDCQDELYLSATMPVESAQAVILEKIDGKLPPGDGQLRQAFYMFSPTHASKISYAKFEQVLRDILGIRLHPALKPRLLAHFDPAGQGYVDFFGFSRRVMGSCPGAALSLENEEPTDVINADTQIKRSWEFERVEECIRNHLTGATGRRFACSLRACDLTRSGAIPMEDFRAVLASEQLDMTQSQFENLLRNFKAMPGSTLGIQDIIDQFVATTAEPETMSGDSYWSGLSLPAIQDVIRVRIESRIGAGPDQHRRVWKYFTPDKSKTLSLASFRSKLRTDLNLNFSKETCEQLLEAYSLGMQGDRLDFAEFVCRVMGYSNDDPSSLEPVEFTKHHVSHVQGNSEMFIRTKVRSAWAELSAAFKRADKDESGVLPASQVKRVLRRFGIDLTPAQFTDLLRDMQADDAGNVEFKQFLLFFESKEVSQRSCRQSLASMEQRAAVRTMVDKVTLKYGGTHERQHLRRAFVAADVNNCGAISVTQLGQVLTRMTELEATPEQITAVSAQVHCG
jgi:Ca2+-binding EF-hand superfamily protein